MFTSFVWKMPSRSLPPPFLGDFIASIDIQDDHLHILVALPLPCPQHPGHLLRCLPWFWLCFIPRRFDLWSTWIISFLKDMFSLSTLHPTDDTGSAELWLGPLPPEVIARHITQIEVPGSDAVHNHRGNFCSFILLSESFWA